MSDAKKYIFAANKQKHKTMIEYTKTIEFLNQTGIPAANCKQLSEKNTATKSCTKLPFEVIIRRYAVGSFLKQHPEFLKKEGELPHRFHRAYIEFFLNNKSNSTPLGEEECSQFLPEGIEWKQMEELSRKTFMVLESAWNNLGYRLIEIQIELSVTDEGKLVITDVVNSNEEQMKAVSLFRIPKQALVFWRGSESDKLPEVPGLPGLHIEQPVISAHKKPTIAVEELERIHSVYPEGGVIIALVGMSNGLGPTLSARTDWPVISVCTTANEHPEDVWSNLRMPSEVPNLTVLSPKNAVLAAFNILGEKNPAIYACRRMAIEALDK